MSEPYAWAVQKYFPVGDKVHTPSCVEMHRHSPPGCCSPDCWCQQDDAEWTWKTIGVEMDREEAESHAYGSRRRVVALHTDPEPDDREGLAEAARDALKYMDHLPTCDFGNDTPDGDFCTCKFAEAKRALRDRLRRSTPEGGEDPPRLSDGSIPDTAYWEDYYDYAVFIKDGALVIESGAIEGGSLECSDRRELRIIRALIDRVLAPTPDQEETVQDGP